MPRWALLKHDTPDGDWHYDWLIERSPGEEHLLTFRVKIRPDDPAVGSFDAHKLPDHRSAYLDFQGEVSGGRGVVARVGEGECVCEQGSNELLITLLGTSPRRLTARMTTDQSPWQFALADPQDGISRSGSA